MGRLRAGGGCGVFVVFGDGGGGRGGGLRLFGRPLSRREAFATFGAKRAFANEDRLLCGLAAALLQVAMSEGGPSLPLNSGARHHAIEILKREGGEEQHRYAGKRSASWFLCVSATLVKSE